MKEPQAIQALAALGHESRLRVFRLLARCGATGMRAGSIARELGVRPPSLSFHLKELAHAGLVVDRREGRSIYYTLDSQSVCTLVGYLLEDCCDRRPELCGPAVDVLKSTRPVASRKKSP
jgi:DNA-binding transcriptional ArsR family regulator